MNPSLEQLNVQGKHQDLNYTLNHIDLTDMCMLFHQRAAQCTFFSSTCETFSRINQMLGNKKVNEFKKIEVR